MKKKITIAAYLAGVTTLAVSLPAMAGTESRDLTELAKDRAASCAVEQSAMKRPADAVD